MNGKCLCGKVTFEAEEIQTNYETCHCGMCRRWSSGPVFTAMVSAVRFSGEEHIGRFDSSQWGQRGFCKECGTNLFYYLKPADKYLMSVGTFDDATPFKLVGEIYVDHQPPGYAFAGDLDRKTEAEFLASLGLAP